jgi:hypothetical protein
VDLQWISSGSTVDLQWISSSTNQHEDQPYAQNHITTVLHSGYRTGTEIHKNRYNRKIDLCVKKCSNAIVPGAFSFAFCDTIRDAVVLQTVRGGITYPVDVCVCMCVCVYVCVLEKLIDKLLLEIEA